MTLLTALLQGEKQTWKAGVQIKKCRYLESAGCVGMCVNMCKVMIASSLHHFIIMLLTTAMPACLAQDSMCCACWDAQMPTQKFFTETFGLPPDHGPQFRGAFLAMVPAVRFARLLDRANEYLQQYLRMREPCCRI